jgi:hypothetical protein
MMRRLYFPFPDPQHARQLVPELIALGVSESHIHAVARTGRDLSGLPPATQRQQHDSLWRLEQTLWSSDLAVFAVAAIGFAAALFAGLALWTEAALAVMAATFAAGALFTLRVPKVHLDEFHEALRHSDVLLMVDVPRARVAEIEELVYRRHPEAVPGGSGWTIDSFGL